MNDSTTPTRSPMMSIQSTNLLAINPGNMTPTPAEHKPASRLPRLLSSPTKPPAGPQPPTQATVRKRKDADETTLPVAKRPATSLGLNASTSATTTARPRGFVPQTMKKPVVAARSTSTSASAAPSRPGQRVPSASTATTTAAPRARPPLTSSITRKPSSSNLGASTSSTLLGRSTNRNVRPLASTTRVGTAQVPPANNRDNERLEGIEKTLTTMQSLMNNDREKLSNLQQSHSLLQTTLATTENAEREARRNLSSAGEELAELRGKHAREIEEMERKLSRVEREKREVEDDLRRCREEVEMMRRETIELRTAISTQSTTELTLKSQITGLQTLNTSLQSEVQTHLSSVSDMKIEVSQARERVEAVEDELRAAETIRRKLHNQVQELKGNIRVFARVRPALPHESTDPAALAEIEYEPSAPDDPQQKITFVTRNQSAMGSARDSIVPFAFDKIFQPAADQRQVFEEISLLAQSVCDGYNVCIFAYGQTGSGKSWTMEGGSSPETAGMIPRAIEMMFRETEALKDRGWEYKMQGQFLEIYNETINDLLGTGEFDSKKHEIKHGPNGKTTVTEVVNIPLDTPNQVTRLLATANRRRAVAATLMNERSSRSHSVFTLKVTGHNPLTGESCDGALNLVDLAGSERLNSSGAGDNKARLQETISINSSLSALKDVIEKLGHGDLKHVPYRNSKLTYLLQTSLSGQSKTLMLCNLSPLAAHASESLCSLRFAKLVNNTTLGTARKHTAARTS